MPEPIAGSTQGRKPIRGAGAWAAALRHEADVIESPDRHRTELNPEELRDIAAQLEATLRDARYWHMRCQEAERVMHSAAAGIANFVESQR